MTLNDTYDRILCKISSGSQANTAKVKRLLQWLAFSARPLSIEEAAEASVLDPKVDFKSSIRLKRPHLIFDMCSSLVVVNKESYVIFAHPSVRRYLVSNLLRESGSPASQFAISATDTHTLITESCFRYIQYLGYPPDPYEFAQSHYSVSPLCEYAIFYWSSHYNSISLGSMCSHTEKLALEFVHQYYRCSLDHQLAEDHAVLVRIYAIQNERCRDDILRVRSMPDYTRKLVEAVDRFKRAISAKETSRISNSARSTAF